MTSSDTQTMRHLQQENIRLRNDINALRDYVDRLQRGLTALVELQDCVTNITKETNVFHLIHEILAISLSAVDSENGSLLLLDDETNELVYVEVIGESRAKLLNSRLEKSLGLAGWVVRNRQCRLVEDTRKDQYFTFTIDNYAGVNPQSLIGTPLLDQQRPLGAIEAVSTRDGRPFTEIDKDVITIVGNLASSAIIAAEKIQS
jgi:NtrC-family two-component system sensor histidine kinase KinB